MNEPREGAPGPWAGRALHFVGMGGSGMSALAYVAARLGARVTGSDRATHSKYVGGLAELGIAPAVGHDPANVPPEAELVYTTPAVPRDNVERVAARQRGQREIARLELIAEITALRPTIGVTGSHGKTTTAAMVAHILLGAGRDPGYILGGRLRSTGVNAGWGEGEWLVLEADESDRLLPRLRAQIAVLTNLEMDHHTTYRSLADIRETVRAYLADPAQAVIWDRPELVALRDGPLVSYDAADVKSDAGGSRFAWRGHEVTLRVPGAHNARNAAAALEACRLAGVAEEEGVAAIADFPGAGRRFEALGTHRSGARVYDDYAHHPTELRATLAAARTLAPARVLAAFQPALLSRTAALWRDFGAALAGADICVVVEVHPDRERWEDYPGVDGRLVAEAAADAADRRTVAWLPSFEDAAAFLDSELRDGDLCLTLGSGSVYRLGHRLVASAETAR
jgi:UDP-N-acetylmuramate--alanine ligase